jgi:SAM-dependent methyltransferase
MKPLPSDKSVDPSPAVDPHIPSAARIYDYLLGGANNFAADRVMAARVKKDAPTAPLFAHRNRDFLRRAVTYLISQGVTQFLDLGSGLPTCGNVHEIAQLLDPTCRVVYVDRDPVATAYGQKILHDANAASVGCMSGRLQDVNTILGSAEVTRLIDLSKPVGLIMAAVLHFVPDSDDPAGIIRQYRDALPSGSRFIFSHVVRTDTHGVMEAARHYDATRDPAHLRSRTEIERLACTFGPLELSDTPVYLSEWHPDRLQDVDADPSAALALCAVAKKCTAVTA